MSIAAIVLDCIDLDQTMTSLCMMYAVGAALNRRLGHHNVSSRPGSCLDASGRKSPPGCLLRTPSNDRACMLLLNRYTKPLAARTWRAC